MTKMRTGKALLILAVVAVFGIGSYAYADWGMGYGRHMGYGRGTGYGPGMMGYADDGNGNWGNLSAEDAQKIKEEQRTFFEATETLRQDIHAKTRELRSELAKENPDAAQASTLQKEISALEGQLDQKRIDHIITLKKITPELGRNFAGRGRTDEGPDDDDGRCW